MTENPEAAQEAREPLTQWKNPPSVTDLKQDLLDAQPVHETQVRKIQQWLENLHVTGSAAPKKVEGRSSIQPKLIRKQAEWRYPSLSDPFLSTEDLYNVKPVSPEDRDSARQNQMVLNHQFNTKINKVRFINQYVRTAVNEGTVVVKTGWVFEEEEYEAEVPDVEFIRNDELAPMHETLAQMKAETPSLYQTDVPDELKQAHDLTLEKGFPVEPLIKGFKKEIKTRTLKNHPTVEVCDYRNVTIDPTCQGDIDKAGFVINSFETSLAELRKDKRYKNLDQIQITNNGPLSQPDHATSEGTYNFNFSDEPRKKFVVYEYWGFRDVDGSGRLTPIVAAWVGNVMIRLEENPFPDKKLPFVVEQYLPVVRENYGEPDGELLEDNQKVIGAVTRGMIDLMGKSANSQTGIRKDLLDATNRRKFLKGEDYEFNQVADPRQGIYQHTFPEIPQSAQFMLQLQNFEAESLTGVKAFNNGISGESLGDVAAGIRGAMDAASKRELDILRRLANGVIAIGRKFISMNAEFLSEEEVIRITDEEFVTVRRDDLAGNFDLQLSISTAEEDNAKAQDLGFMLQTMGPNMDPAMSQMILADIARLKKMPDLARKIERYQPQPDPMAQKLQELEIAKLDAEIAKLRAEAQKTLVDAGLSEAKIGTEQAKAANLGSDTDLKNLDFVEQESGVKQEREKELHGAQAQAQGETERIKQETLRQKGQIDLTKAVLQLQTTKEKQKAKSTA